MQQLATRARPSAVHKSHTILLPSQTTQLEYWRYYNLIGEQHLSPYSLCRASYVQYDRTIWWLAAWMIPAAKGTKELSLRYRMSSWELNHRSCRKKAPWNIRYPATQWSISASVLSSDPRLLIGYHKVFSSGPFATRERTMAAGNHAKLRAFLW